MCHGTGGRPRVYSKIQKEAEHMLYIGVDLGTSACKFLLVDDTGRVLNTVSNT